MHSKERITRMIGIILSLLLLCSLHGQAEGLTIEPTNSEETITKGTDYTYVGDLLTVKTATPVTIDGNSTITTDHIVVLTGTKAEITLNNVLIDVSNQKNNCAFDIQGNASATLILVGKNSMISYYGSNENNPGLAGIHCAKADENTASLTIQGSGFLEAKGGYNCAGIGGNYVADYPTKRKGEATGEITILGGTITAIGGNNAPGIGEATWGKGGTVTILGGTITATSEISDEGIYCDHIITTPDGNALIIAGNIDPRMDRETDNNYKNKWKGVIFEKNVGKVYGNTVTLETNATIPSGKTLTVEDGKKLVISSGTTLINEGTITNNGTISNNGVLAVKGTLTSNNVYNGSGVLYQLSGGTVTGPSATEGILITFDGNASSEAVTNLPSVQVTAKSGGSITAPTVTPLRTDYTFVGWSESSTGGSLITDFNTVTLSGNDKTIYACWKYNTKLVFTGDSYSNTYGETTPLITAVGASGSSVGNVTCTYYSDAECTNGISTPTNAGTYYVKAIYAGNDDNMKAELITTYTIEQKELTVTPIEGQNIYSDEFPAYTVSGAVGDEKPAFEGNLKVNEGKVNDDNLTLADDDVSGFKAANYTWKLSSTEVAITQYSKTLTQAYEVEAAAISSAVGTGWHKENMVLTPSSDFQIKGSSTLKSSDVWLDQLTVDGVDGVYDVTYRLLCKGRTTESEDQTLSVNLDKTAPIVTPVADKLTLTVALSDATSGLASCTYTWNNGGEVVETLTQGVPTHSFTLTARSAGSYPLKVVLTDRAGNATTYNGTVTLTEPYNPVDPPTPPTPSVIYTVTLPAVEGVMTDPVAGNYEVEGWNSFRFYLTLDAAYNQSVPIVTTDRGETLEPRSSDGAYIVKYLRQDVAIDISGIVKNPDPVANGDVSTSALRIYVAEGILCLDVPISTEAYLITADGRILRTLHLSPGTNRVYGLREGIYIIRLSDGTTQKIWVGNK